MKQIDLYGKFIISANIMRNSHIGADPWLPRFIADLASQGGRFDIEILDNSLSYPLIKAVIDGKVDIAICGGEIDDRRVRRHHLFDDELVAVLPACHRLATRRHLEAADF